MYSFLHEFICYLQIRISPEDLEKERGAVLEEYRLGRDANGRLGELCFASVLQGSKVSVYSNCKHSVKLALEKGKSGKIEGRGFCNFAAKNKVVTSVAKMFVWI